MIARRALIAAATCALAGSAAGCATAQVGLQPKAAAEVQRDLTGQARFLRVSMYVTPFFGDDTKRLVTAVHPTEVRLLNNPDGTPITPGAIETIWKVGAKVRIEKIEFPSALEMSQRMIYTPRTLAWVWLRNESESHATPKVLVLRPGIQDEKELFTELERYLVTDAPVARLEGLTEAQRLAVEQKEASLDMPPEALEMAWGYPERRVIELVGDKKKETWTWPSGKRVAVLLDGRVSELRPAPAR